MTHHHRSGLWSKMVSLAATVALAGAAEPETAPALREVFKGRFDVGVAVETLPGNYQPEELALLRRHFNIVTWRLAAPWVPRSWAATRHTERFWHASSTSSRRRTT